jgi:hypothetical protein
MARSGKFWFAIPWRTVIVMKGRMHDPRCPPFVELSMTAHPVEISVSAKRSVLDLELAVRVNNSTGATQQRANMQPFSHLDFSIIIVLQNGTL